MNVVLMITDSIAARTQNAQIKTFLKRMLNAGLSASFFSSLDDQIADRQTDPKDTILITDCPDLAIEGTGRGYCCIGLDAAGKQTFPGVRVLAQSLDGLTPAFLGLTYAHHHGVPAIIHQSPTFVLRESIPDDFPALDEIFSQCEDTVFGHFSILEGKTYAQRKERFDAYVRTVYRYYGYGMWTVLIGNCVAGWFGICPGEGTQEPYASPQLAFVLGTAYRHLGYGRQICGAVLRYAREELGFSCMSLWTRKENLPAIALAKTMNFTQKTPENTKKELLWFHLDFRKNIGEFSEFVLL